MTPLRIHFDLSSLDEWHRREWEAMLSVPAEGAAGARVVDQPEAADCVVAAETNFHLGRQGRLWGRWPALAPGARPLFVWDSSDLPSGRRPGLYCSLPRSLFDPRRHRSFCYPIRYNECIQAAAPADAQHLYGFVGGITSGVRRRLVATLRRVGRPAEMLLVEQAGPWNQMFDRGGLPAKRQYAEALRRSRFFLCPRGNGVGSVRLFETMEAARVPVIISDAYVPPAGIDWDNCSVRVSERQLERIPEILASRSADWPRLAANARRAWEAKFSPAAKLGTLAGALRELLAGDTRETWRNRARLTVHWARLHTRRRLGALRGRLPFR